MSSSRQTGQFGPKVGQNWASKKAFLSDENSMTGIRPRGSTRWRRLARFAQANGPDLPKRMVQTS